MKRLFALLVLSLGLQLTAAAHDSRPVYVEITELGAGRYGVLLKAPTSIPSANVPELVMPDTCAQDGEGIDAGGARSESFIRQRQYLCSAPLAGERIAIRYPILNPSLSALIRVQTASGAILTRLMGPMDADWEVPSEPTRGGIAREYALLGIRHIMEGLDHLLFVLGLLFLVGDRRMLLKTITAFTLAHSITLAIATLGFASAPLEPLNVAIALSILFLGPEIVRLHRGQTSLTIRHPWIVAFGFGLLHGFGFASGLSGIGLPQGEIPVALLLFNVGVEIGQVGIVLIVVLLERSFRLLEVRWPRWAVVAPGYVVGSLGAFWAIQRFFIMIR